MATLESQKYVIARTVWTENNLLVSGHLVDDASGTSLFDLVRPNIYFQRCRKQRPLL